MSDDWKTLSQPRLIGHMTDAYGHSVAISIDRDDIIIRRGGHDIRLAAAERDTIMRIYMQAERRLRRPDEPRPAPDAAGKAAERAGRVPPLEGAQRDHHRLCPMLNLPHPDRLARRRERREAPGRELVPGPGGDGRRPA